MSYKKLKIWQEARRLSIDIHKMSMKLSKFEQFETGSQIRRSSKSIRSNIVEGYGRRMYKSDYIKFLIYAHSSVDETRDHLETLYETKSLADEHKFQEITNSLNKIGRMLYKYIQTVQSRS
jgi:four helix bundle protein